MSAALLRLAVVLLVLAATGYVLAHPDYVLLAAGLAFAAALVTVVVEELRK